MADIITNPDVKLAFDTIKAKRPIYTQLYQYYEGHHPLRYSTEKLRKVFEALKVYFAENWLAVVIDAVLDRLQLNGFDISKNPAAKKRLDELWQEHDIAIIAEDVHESITITNEGFVIAMNVMDEDTGDEVLEIFYNDPRMVHVFYKSDQPNKKLFAAKLWQNDMGFICLSLYYVDRFEHYISKAAMKPGQMISNVNQLIPDPEIPEEENPFDKIPVFHWRTSSTTKRRDMGPSEISMQDAINKLFSDMMVSSEFNSFKQRIIISKADPGNLPNESGVNWWIPAGDEGQGTSVQELGGGVVDGFLQAIDKLATSLAIITRTPKHYFFSQGGDPSGEALLAMEAPLNKKVKKRQGRYKVEWRNLAQFLLELEGIQVDRVQIQPIYEPAETVQPKTRAEITKTETEAGIPLVTSLRRQGWSDADLKQLAADKQDELKLKTGLAQNALDELRALDASSNQQPDAANNGGRSNTQASE